MSQPNFPYYFLLNQKSVHIICTTSPNTFIFADDVKQVHSFFRILLFEATVRAIVLFGLLYTRYKKIDIYCCFNCAHCIPIGIIYRLSLISKGIDITLMTLMFHLLDFEDIQYMIERCCGRSFVAGQCGYDSSLLLWVRILRCQLRQ